jgi:hypothetical protein
LITFKFFKIKVVQLFTGYSHQLSFSLLRKATPKATRNATENVSSALLSPPKNATIAPTKNTEVAVKKTANIEAKDPWPLLEWK